MPTLFVLSSFPERRSAVSAALEGYGQPVECIEAHGQLPHLASDDLVVVYSDEFASSDQLEMISRASGRILAIIPSNGDETAAEKLGWCIRDILWEDRLNTELCSRVTMLMKSKGQGIRLTNPWMDGCVRLVAHDVNNPLTAIRILAEMLQGDLTDPESQQDMRDILEAADMAAATMESLSFLLKLQVPQDSGRWEIVNLAGVIQELMRRPAFIGRVNVVRLDETCDVVGSRNLVRLALTDLLLNARKLTDNKSTIELSLQSTPDGAQMRCTAVNCGVSEDKHETLMAPFGSVALRHQQVPVTPTGLHAAAALCGIINGRLTLVNNATGGLEATVFFPRA